MSFAPLNQKRDFNNHAPSPGTSQQSYQKRTIPLESPESQREIIMGSNGNGIHHSQGNNVGLQNRLEVIESHLNRVCNQHDALMPLLSLLETVPKINNSEQNMKVMSKKIQDLEAKFEKLEQSFNTKNNQHVFVQIDKNFKNTSQQISQMKNEMKEIQFSLGNNSKVAEAKLREEAQNVYRNVDVKIDRNKKDIQNLLAEFKNSIALSIKRQEDQSSSLRSPGEGGNKGDYSEGAERNVQERVDGIVDSISKQYERDMNNLYREIGMLRSEVELIYDKGRRTYIFDEINRFPQDMDQDEKKIAIANLEQSVFFEDIERFDKENQERLVYELDCLEDQISQVSHQAINAKTNTDVKQEATFLEDRLFSLKNQVHGTKKKYLIDIRKIEDRLEKLIIMKDQSIEKAKQLNKMSVYLQQNLQEIEVYPQRIEQLNDSISSNVELLQARQKEIDEKLSLLKNIRS